MKVQLPTLNDEILEGVVVSQKHNSDGSVIGRANNNSILDSTVFTVKFDEDHYQNCSANVIWENLYKQINDEGNL